MAITNYTYKQILVNQYYLNQTEQKQLGLPLMGDWA